MKKRSVLLFVALSAIAFGALAETPNQKQFYNVADRAAFECEVKSSVLQTAIQYGSPKRGEYATAVWDCTSEKGKALAEAFKTIPNTPQNKDIREAAKKVYSAWLAYSDVLSRGISYLQVKTVEESVAFRKALSDYKTEIELAVATQ